MNNNFRVCLDKLRIYLILSEDSFTDKPIFENNKLLDTKLKEKIDKPECKIGFFHILLKYYNKWIEANRNIEETKKFLS